MVTSHILGQEIKVRLLPNRIGYYKPGSVQAVVCGIMTKITRRSIFVDKQEIIRTDISSITVIEGGQK